MKRGGLKGGVGASCLVEHVEHEVELALRHARLLLLVEQVPHLRPARHGVLRPQDYVANIHTARAV